MLRPSCYLGGRPDNNCCHILSVYLVKTLFSLLYSLEGGASVILILLKEAQRNEDTRPISHCWTLEELGSGGGNWASEPKLLSTRLPGEAHTPGAMYMNVHCSTEDTKRCEQLHCPSQGWMGGSLCGLLCRSQKEWTGSTSIKVD